MGEENKRTFKKKLEGALWAHTSVSLGAHKNLEGSLWAHTCLSQGVESMPNISYKNFVSFWWAYRAVKRNESFVKAETRGLELLVSEALSY